MEDNWTNHVKDESFAVPLSREAEDIERQRRWLDDARMERLARFMFESGYGGDYFFGGPGRHTDSKDGSSWVSYTWDELHNAHKRGWREKAVRVLEHLGLEPARSATGEADDGEA